MARLLGIDFGEKRIGVALSDEGVRLAFPHTTIINNKDSINELMSLIEDYEVGKIVIGESKDFNMKENRIMEEAHSFAESLESKFSKLAKDIEIVFHAEFLTSVQVEKTHFQLSERHKDRGVKK